MIRVWRSAKRKPVPLACGIVRGPDGISSDQITMACSEQRAARRLESLLNVNLSETDDTAVSLSFSNEPVA